MDIIEDYYKMDHHSQYVIIDTMYDHSFDGFLGKENHWYECSSCEQLLSDMVDLYDLERVEYLVNLYESKLITTEFTSSKESKILFMGDEVNNCLP